jgi:hypothetical protein
MDLYREEHISLLDRVHNKVAKFAHHRNDSNWETLAERRKVARICALFETYTGEQACKTIGRKNINAMLSEQIRS